MCLHVNIPSCAGTHFPHLVASVCCFTKEAPRESGLQSKTIKPPVCATDGLEGFSFLLGLNHSHGLKGH